MAAGAAAHGGVGVSRFVDTVATGFFQRGLIEVVLVGALAGLVGAHVLVRRLPFFVVTMSHATFPGVVVAGALGVSLVLGGLVAGLVVVALLLWLGRERAVGDSTVTGVLLAGAFALGVVLASARTSGSRDLAAYLVGSVLTVTTADVVLTVVLGALVVAVLALLHKELLFGAFDPVAAAAQGYRLVLLDAVAMVVVLVTMVIAIPSVGTLLAVALLVVPALTARQWTDRLAPAMVLGAVLGAAAGVVGMLVTAAWPVAAGAAVALASGAGFVVSVAVQAVRQRPRPAVPGTVATAPVGSPS